MARESKEVVGQHLLRVAHGGQIIGPIPFEQQVAEGEQPVAGCGRQIQSEGGSQAGGRVSPLMPPLPAPRRFEVDEQSEMAAGVMPWMRTPA